MKYVDYVNLDYKPSKKDLICEFFVEPLRISMKRACGAVAAESSIGTWTETTTTKPYVEKLAAKVFEMKGNKIKIAYPSELFEPGNISNIMSSIAGNVFGMKEIKNLRLNDVNFPSKILKSFKGPKYGIRVIRKLLKISKRPLVGTIIKPKLGLKTEDHVKTAYEAWLGGCDLVKDDENLGNQRFNRFEKRLKKTLKARDKAEKETGEKKVYLPNVTAETNEMIRRVKLVQDCGGRYIMVDVITVGWASLQTLRNQDFNLILHAHRAGHGAFTKNSKHGISMKVIAKLVRIVGLDQLHVGTAVGKMFETKEEVLERCDALRRKLNGLKPVMPVASGGLHPGLVPELMKIFGRDVIIQAGGGVHGHKLGTKAGAKAMRQAVDAIIKNISLKKYVRKNKELYIALKMWK
jgi:ribulose-bisphosphate carboxylase large chain